MDQLAQRWHIPPSVVLAEPAWLVMGCVRGEEEVSDEDEMRLMLADRAEIL